MATGECINGNCLEEMRLMPDNCMDSIVTDPPYERGFMGKTWDSTGIAHSVELWREALRVLKPGGHLLAFGGSRTYHRLACAIEDAGFQIRDQIMWLYGTGFPKSMDVSKAIDKAAGAEREVLGMGNTYCEYLERGEPCRGHGDAQKSQSGQTIHSPVTAPATAAAKEWEGWGTALKPSHEPIVLARKPFDGTVAENVQRWRTGALNIDAARIASEPWKSHTATGLAKVKFFSEGEAPEIRKHAHAKGKHPANTIHDGLEEAWAKFFYCAKASNKDRGESNNHPTVKPNELMRYLCRLVTPKGGNVLDPFCGSGSTGVAAVQEGFEFFGIEQSPEYTEIANRRIASAT